MATLYIDFETTSECDLKAHGAWMYSRHPTTDVLCMAFAVDDGPVRIWVPGDETFSKIWCGTRNIEAHNAFFERAIWTNLMVAHHGWPRIEEDQWRCSAALAASYALPRKLEQVAEVLKLKNKKDPRGQKLILKTNGKNRKELTDAETQDLYAYCKQDVEVERELAKRLGSLSSSEQEIWKLDQKINFRGVSFDRPSVNNAISLMSEYTETLKKEVVVLSKGALSSTNQRDRSLDWLAENGVDMDGLTKGAVEVQMKADMPPDVRRLLEIRQQLARNSVKKFQAMINTGDSDDKIRDCFMYYGATTGRWTGKNVQFQNLPRGVISDPDTCIDLINTKDLEILESCYPDVMGAISSCIRGMIVAEEGHMLIGADYAQIETRMLFWLAGERIALDKLRNGDDLYEDMASSIYKTKTVDKAQRQLGKIAILGLGYGMGWRKFKVTCATFGIEISDDMAQIVVKLYRDKYREVVKFWYAIDDAAKAAINNPGTVVRHRLLRFICEKGYLRIDLPSERPLYYWSPNIQKGEMGDEIHFMSQDAKTKQWVDEKTYGGKLTENIVQAASRDILAEAMLKLDKEGFDITMHVHDETVVQVPEDKIESSKIKLETLMQELPWWASGLPLKVEASVFNRYQK